MFPFAGRHLYSLQLEELEACIITHSSSLNLLSGPNSAVNNIGMDNSENGRVIHQSGDHLVRQERQGEHTSSTADRPLTMNPLAANPVLARQDEYTSSTSSQEAIRGKENTTQQPLYPRTLRSSHLLADGTSSSINFSRQACSSLQTHGPSLWVPGEQTQGERPLYSVHKNASTGTRRTAEGLQPPTPSEIESEHSMGSDDAYYCEVGEEDNDMGTSVRFATREESPLSHEYVQTEVVRGEADGGRLQLQDQEVRIGTAQESTSSPSGAGGQVADESRAKGEKREDSKFARFLKRTPKGRFGCRKPRKDDGNMGGTTNA
jgi:hypothetical protein